MPSPIFRDKIYSLAILNIKKYKLRMIELFSQISTIIAGTLVSLEIICRLIWQQIRYAKRKAVTRKTVIVPSNVPKKVDGNNIFPPLAIGVLLGLLIAFIASVYSKKKK